MPQPFTTFYLVRHGESEANVLMESGQRLEKGLNWNVDLTDRGVQQATEKFEKFKEIHFDAAFSSDLLRAKRTAEIIAAERDLVVITTEAIRESNASSYYYFDPEKAAKLRDLLKTLSEEQRMVYSDAPDMETYEAAASRLIRFMREAAVAYPGKTVLIVAHGTIMRAFLIKIGFGSFTELPSRAISNTGYAVVKSDGLEFEVTETNGIERKTETTSK